MLKKFKTLTISSLILHLGLSAAYAAPTPDYFNMSLEELMDIKVTTSSKHEEKAFEAASAIYVITNEDIRRSGVTSIPEALRMAPGLQVARIDSSKWAITSRGFNEQFSNKLLVLFDGRSVYTPLFSGVYWDTQDYILEDIDRIEVVRGPGGALWGANAVNGVINIITKKAEQTQGGYVSQTNGNLDQNITEARFGGKTANKTYYRTYAKFSDHGSTKNLAKEHANNDWRMSRVGFKAETNEDKKDIFSVQGDAYEGYADQPFIYTTTFNYDESIRGGNIIAKWNREFHENSHLDVQFYYDLESRNIAILDQKRHTADIDIQYSFTPNSKNFTLVGAEYRFIKDKLESDRTIESVRYLNYTPASRKYDIISTFVQNKTEIVKDKLFLTLGTKLDHNDFTGFEYQPTARMSYLPNENHTFWAAASKAVRTPTRGEDGLVLDAVVLSQSGSPGYHSEDLYAYEVGYRFKTKEKFSLDLTTFYNDYHNLRSFELDQGSSTAYTIYNDGSGEVYGFEADAKLEVTRNWRLSAAYTFLASNLHNKKNGATYLSDAIRYETVYERSSPKNQFNLRSHLNITPKLELDNSLYYVDNVTQGNIPNYVKFDMRIGYNFTKNLSAAIVGQNLTDRYHQEFDKSLFSEQTQIGRTVHGTITYKF